MENDLRFAVIGFRPLEGVALRRMLIDDIGSPADVFASIDAFLPVADRYDAFIVTPSIALFYPDFFVTRRQRVAVISDEEHVSASSQFIAASSSADERELTELLRRLAASARKDSPQGELSSREIDVLREVASGKTNKEIADSLCISVNTVITHRRNISVKLGIRSASGLSLYAMMNGLV